MSILTYDEALAELKNLTSSGKLTLENLMDLGSRVSVAAAAGQVQGSVTLFYSGPVGGVKSSDIIEEMLENGSANGLRLLDKTQAAQFLKSDAFNNAFNGLLDGKSDAEINAANNLLKDAKTGPWAESSRRFAVETIGEVRFLGPVADISRTFGATELPALLDHSQATRIEGIPIENLRSNGLHDAFKAITARSLQSLGISGFNVAAGVGGAVDSLNLGDFLKSEVLDPEAYTKAQPGAMQHFEEFWRTQLTETEKSTLKATSRSLGTRLLGPAGDLLVFGIALSESANAAEEGDTEKARKIMEDWAIEAAGSSIGATVVSIAAGAAAVGVGVVSAPVLAAVGIGAAIIGGIWGSKAATDAWADYRGSADQDELNLLEKLAAQWALSEYNLVFGTAASDTLTGTAGNDYLFGGGSNDTLDGLAGDDVLRGGAGNDTLNGGEGADQFNGGDGNDTLNGGDGNDTYLINGQDTIIDSDGQGRIQDKSGRSVSGFIQIRSDGSKVFLSDPTITVSGDANLTLTWADGNSVVINDFTSGDFGIVVTQELINDFITFNTIEGDTETNKDDEINDTSQYDFILAGVGNDVVVKSLGGDDVIDLGSGDDELYTQVAAPGSISAFGGDGRDYLGAGGGQDVLQGGEGADDLYGAGGNDVIYGDLVGLASDFILKGATEIGSGLQGEFVDAADGDDQVFTGSGNDFVGGGDGHDLIVTGGGRDYIYGDLDTWSEGGQWVNWSVTETVIVDAYGQTVYHHDFSNFYVESNDGVGNDIIYAGAGDDVVYGAYGDDTIFLEGGNDFARGGEGNDLISGGAGDDHLNGQDSNDVLEGEDGADYLAGEDGDDWLTGGDGIDHLQGGMGNDYMDGGLGVDKLIGAGGNDELHGGDNDDTLHGDANNIDDSLHGDDEIYGEGGNDSILGGGGNDYISGGAGADEVGGLGGDDSIFGGDGNDKLYSHSGNDNIYGETGDDWLQGDEGLDFVSGGAGNDTVLGGMDNDWLSGEAGADHLQGDEGDDALDGGADNDVLLGGLGSDRLSGGMGADHLQGDEGDDTLDGGTDNDILLGGSGRDTLVGGSGIDRLFGEAGNDNIYGDAGDDWLQGDEGLDFISGGAGNDSMLGGIDNDSLSGGAGADHLQGDEGDDTLEGGIDNDILYGVLGSDRLVGGSGLDRLYGGAGNDTLIGGANIDLLDGGEGDDTYIFNMGDSSGGEGEKISDTLGNNTIVFDSVLDASQISILANYQDQASNDLFIMYSDRDFLRLTDGLTGTRPTISFGDGSSFNLNVIDGRAVNAPLVGTLMNDIVVAGAGNDVLSGGSGQDYLYGGRGADTYRFSLGDGNDSIYEGYYAENYTVRDKIEFGVGFAKEDMIFSGSSNDLIISFSGNTESLRIQDWFIGTANVIEDIYFSESAYLMSFGNQGYYLSNVGTAADDMLYGIENQYSKTDLLGLSGNDMLIGGIGYDTLDGGVGDDTLRGGKNDDVYTFGRGYGKDVIDESMETGSGGYNRVRFKEDIAFSDIRLSRFGDDLIVTVIGSDDQLMIKGWWGTNSTAGWGKGSYIDEFIFGDGKTLSSREINSMSFAINSADFIGRIHGSAIDDTIVGLAKDDVIWGGAGNDVLEGRDGNDALSGGIGRDILYGDGGDDSLNGSDGDDTIYGGSGSDYINGGAGSDLLDGGAGNDTLEGYWYPGDYDGKAGLGLRLVDTFVFGRGYGKDVIYGVNGDRVLIKSGVSSSDVRVSRNGNDLVMSIVDSPDTLTFTNWFYSDVHKITDFVFENGSKLEFTDPIFQDYLKDDTYYFGRGAGSYQINDSIGTNKIVFGNDITASDVVISRSKEYLTFSIAGTEDRLRMTVSDYPGFQLVFSDSSNLPSQDYVLGINSQILLSNGVDNGAYGSVYDDIIHALDGGDEVKGHGGDDTVYGGGGNDTLYGGDGNDFLDGGSGNDILEGNYGSDTYFFGIGSGMDTIRDFDSNDSSPIQYGFTTDKLVFGPGISAADIQISTSGLGLELRIYNTEDRIIMEDWFRNPNSRIEEFVFEDGSKLPTSEGAWYSDWVDPTLRHQIIGGDRDDSLSGLLLDGGAGNDRLSGGGSGDVTYVFARGYGHDTIYAHSNYWSRPNIDPSFNERLLLGTDIGLSDIELVRNGQDLVLRIVGTHDQVTFFQWYYEDHTIGQLVFTDGSGVILTTAEIDTMVSYSNNAPVLVTPLIDQFAKEAESFRFQVPASSFVDNDAGGYLTYSATLADNSALPSWLRFDTTTRTFTGSPTVLDLGNLDVKVTASDSFGMSVSDTFRVRVNAAVGNTVLGTSANDHLTGTTGSDTLFGGAGADTLLAGFGNDIYVIDNVSDVVVENPGEGVDTIKSAVSYTLSPNVENLTLIGSSPINGSGNGLANVIAGNNDKNYLDGGIGADTLSGGLGDDTYVVDNAGDSILEYSGEGIDTVQSSIAYTLGANVENLTLTGTEGTNGTGNALGNIIVGNSGNNYLDGGAGVDTMIGGAGDDMYIVDHVMDVVTEGVNEGTDGLLSSVDYSLGANVEKLFLKMGTAAVTGTGNDLNNLLSGNDLANTLRGHGGDDYLYGGYGVDTLIGGADNDIYYVEGGDVVIENPGEGIDSVAATTDYTLEQNVENLFFLIGSSAINGTGNDLNNLISGNERDNTLFGGGGNDQILGAVGNDTLFGQDGEDTLDGGPGNDILVGASGADEYAFGRGAGEDSIYEYDPKLGVIDQLTVGTGVTADQLWFRHIGNDLEVSIIGTADRSTFKNWYLGNVYHVEQFKTADGKTLLDTQVDALVNAMAAFAPPAAGQSTLPTEYQTALNPVIAANWQ
ncbi:MAG: calcium-binding protein [Pseudomonadota bacterium]